MKPRSVFDTLSPEDRERIITLCSRMPYKQALAILSQPRPEGIGLQSSVSALCRFYARAHPVAQNFQVDVQLAEALDQGFFESGDTFNRGIIALL
jgi:hypothetical protein